MNRKPIISIIVPIYNVEDYLDRCVESILNQTFKDFELILVDDGSPDNCPMLCDKWAEKDSRIKVVHKPNGGVSSARNAGLAVSQGDYIGFCDPDDVINYNMYELMYKSIINSNSDCCVCAFKSFSSDNEISIKCIDGNEKNLVLEGKNIIEYFLGDGRNLLGCVWDKLIKKSFIFGMAFNEDMAFGEDYCFSLKAILNCNRISVIESPDLYYYFIRENSAMRKLNGEKYHLLYEQKQMLFDECLRRYSDKDVSIIVESARIRALVATFLNADDKVLNLMKSDASRKLKNVLKSKEIYWKEKAVFVKKLYLGVKK